MLVQLASKYNFCFYQIMWSVWITYIVEYKILCFDDTYPYQVVEQCCSTTCYDWWPMKVLLNSVTVEALDYT